MGRLGRVFNRIKRALRRRGARPQDIASILDAPTLESALKEARFLQSQHAVDIRPLQPGEIPGPPRRADTAE